jgi:hypothetical protein
MAFYHESNRATYMGEVLAGPDKISCEVQSVDDELLMPVLARGLDDPREAAGPVVAAA